MANIRDQCSWVHSAEPEKATEKAKDLVRMTVGRTVGLLPLVESTVPVKNAALIIGGGVGGMTAGLSIADQGYQVHLVEKENILGGMARDIHETLDKSDVSAFEQYAQTLHKHGVVATAGVIVILPGLTLLQQQAKIKLK